MIVLWHEQAYSHTNLKVKVSGNIQVKPCPGVTIGQDCYLSHAVGRLIRVVTSNVKDRWTLVYSALGVQP